MKMRGRSIVLALFTGVLIAITPRSAVSQQGDWDACNGKDAAAALAACTRIIDRSNETAKNRAAALLKRGMVHYDARDFALALRDFSDGLALDTGNTQLLDKVFLATTLNGEIDKAVPLAERLIAINASHRTAALVLAVRAFRQKQHPQVARLLAKSPRGTISDLTVGLLTGWSQYAAGDARKAVETIDRVSGADWYGVFKEFHAGLIFDLAGRSRDAGQRLERTHAGDAKALRVVEAYGRWLSRHGSTEAALRVFRAFDEAPPSHPLVAAAMASINGGRTLPPLVDSAETGAAEVLFGLGAALARQPGAEIALFYLQLAAYLNPAHPLVLHSIADLYETWKKPGIAIGFYQRVPGDSLLRRSAEIQLATNLDAVGRTGEAKRILTRLITEQPNDLEARMALGNILRAKQSFAECAEAYGGAVAKLANPQKSNWSLFYFRGICYERSGQWPSAEADLKKALELFPDQPQVLNYLGYSWIDRHANLEQGLQMIKRAVELRPDDGYIVDSLAWAHYRLRDYDDAMKHSLRAVALKPDDATIQRHLGMIHAVKAQLEPALKRMDEAIRLDAADAESYVERGNVHAQMGNHEKAIADINRAIQLSPNTAAFYESRGSVTAARNDHEGAIRDFSEALRLDPALTSAYARRGQVHLQAADFNAAVRDFEAAIGRDRRAATAEQYNGRGFAFLQLGDLDRAIADFDEAIRLDSRLAASYANRGNAWRKKGDPERAIGDLSDALRYDSSMTSAYVDRGLAFEAKGDRERARSDFNAALARPIGASAAARTALDIARARLAALTAATSTAAATSSTPAPAQRRIALVIGNSAYKSVPALPNPRRDAERVATTLRAVGFQAVTLQGDLTREKLVDALRAFARAADTADWALVYFAGHGIEIGGVNYLIPVDARLESDRDAPLDAVPLEQVLGAVEGARKLRLVLLDACRDNPFANQMRRTSASRSVGRGLARVEPGAGTMIAYAAKHGSLAFDGDGNSPFATALIKRLQVPGIELRRLFDLVRDDVVDATGGRQEPFTYGSLSGREDFYFVSK